MTGERQDGYLSDVDVQTLAAAQAASGQAGRLGMALAGAVGDIVARTVAESGPDAAGLTAMRLLRPFSEAALNEELATLASETPAATLAPLALLFRDVYESAALALGGAL